MIATIGSVFQRVLLLQSVEVRREQALPAHELVEVAADGEDLAVVRGDDKSPQNVARSMPSWNSLPSTIAGPTATARTAA